MQINVIMAEATIPGPQSRPDMHIHGTKFYLQKVDNLSLVIRNAVYR